MSDDAPTCSIYLCTKPAAWQTRSGALCAAHFVQAVGETELEEIKKLWRKPARKETTMTDPYVIDCSGFCLGAYELRPPDSYVFAGLFARWMYEEGWTRSMTGAYLCPDCSHQHDKDHAQEEPHHD